MSIVDFCRARFGAAKDSSDVSALDALVEAVARVREGEWPAHSVIIIGMIDADDGSTAIQVMHGGGADTNQRLGMLTRAEHLAISSMYGE